MHQIIIENIFISRASLKFGYLLKQSILKQSSFFALFAYFFIATPHDYCSKFFRSCPFFATTFFNRHIIIFSFFAHQHHVPYKCFFLLFKKNKRKYKIITIIIIERTESGTFPTFLARQNFSS